MNKRVYFAQPTNGGPIKIGSTHALKERIAILGGWVPGGVEVIAAIPGYRVRETALQMILKPWRIQGEWFRSCAQVWGVIIEADRDGDLSWLPAEPDPKWSNKQLSAELINRFGSVAAATRELRSAPVSLTYDRGEASNSIVGKFLAHRAIHAHEIPPFIADRRSEPAEAQ